MEKNKKINHKDKFSYKKGDLKIVKPKKKVKESSLVTFSQFLIEKQVKFDKETMRWITIHDTNNRLQHILISKKDGTVLGGMGGSLNGKKINDVFSDFEDKKHFDSSEALTGEAIHYECSLEDHVKLSWKEKKHIIDYSGQMYQDVNECLRNYDMLMMAAQEEDGDEDPLVGYSGMTVSELVDYADVISGALKKHRTPKPIITYRGITDDYFNDHDIDLEPGTELWDYGFASTSSDVSVAERFCGEGYIMEVHIPKGSKAASIDSLSNFAGDEKEVLIDRGACFTIKEVDKKNKRLIVELSHEED